MFLGARAPVGGSLFPHHCPTHTAVWTRGTKRGMPCTGASRCPAVTHTASPPFSRHAAAHHQPRQRLPGPVRPTLCRGRGRGPRPCQSRCQLPRQLVPISRHNELPTRRLPGGTQGDTFTPPACTHLPEDVPVWACLLPWAWYQGGAAAADHPAAPNPTAPAGVPPVPELPGPSPATVQLWPCVGLSQPHGRLLHR